MAGAACKLLLCGSKFAAETASANGIAGLTGMTAADLDALILQKVGDQTKLDALIAELTDGVAAMGKVNEELMLL